MPSEDVVVLVGGSTIVLVVPATFSAAGRSDWLGALRLVGCVSTGVCQWNWARPVPEGDRARCWRSGLVTVSFPGRACHPLTT
jgi:hypothetical protein